MQKWVWLLPAVTALAYAVLVFGFGPMVDAGGQPPFDLRAAGYDLTQAQAFLAALTPQGRAAYLGPVRINDTVFPVLMGLTLALPLWRRGWLWVLPAVLYTALDLAENAAIADLLRNGAREEVQVFVASALTQAKFAVFGVAAVLALWALWRNRRPARLS